MLRSLAHTVEIAEVSWGILRRDGLLLFPLAMTGALLGVLLYVLVAFEYGGTFQRMMGSFQFMLADLILLGLAYLGAAFAVTYFSAALISAVHYRILGGTPDFRSGLEAANDRLGALVLWSAFAATFGLAFRPLCRAPGVAGRLGRYMANAVGGWATSLVLPVMMAEGAAPPAAMQRASEVYLDTWHRGDVARQGFGPLFVGHLVLTVAFGAGAFVLGASFAVVLMSTTLCFALGVSFLRCLEQLFMVAVYQYAAAGEPDCDFPEAWVTDAFGHGRAVRRIPGAPASRRAAA